MRKNRRKKKKLKKSVKVVMISILLFLALGIVFFFTKEQEILENKHNEPQTKEKEKEPEKKVQVIDVNSKSRNIAVMINNIKTVWGYQSGLQDAHIIYEIIAEGGITRFMAVFKDKDTARIGTIRSARIYYLDYALENDAIYVHIGGSKEALRDIKELGMADLNSEVTFRDKSLGLAYEHTAFASMEKIKDRIQKRKIRNTKEKDDLLNYSIEEIDLSKMEGSIKADKVLIQYSGYKDTSFVYDENTKVYKRFQNDKAHTDYVTKEQYTAKNIITYQVKNASYDSYGRQYLENTGTGNGYYISNGYAVPIKWKKDKRESQTVYTYLNGEEITVNDGNTYIQIQPKNKKFMINELNY